VKSLFSFGLIIVLASACGVEIKSVGAQLPIETPYKNLLIVIPWVYGSTQNFVHTFKQKIEKKFQQENRKVEFLLIETEGHEFKLDAVEVKAKINSSITADSKDLMLVFRVSNVVSYDNTGIVSLSYAISGMDLQSGKNIWNTEITSVSKFGPATYAGKAASRIYEKLKADRII
jgi:hypothetical protein